VSDEELIEAVRPRLYPWSRMLARRSSGGLLDADDLYQEALIAALDARRTWRPDGGASLVTHAANRGRGAMVDALRKAARHCRRDAKTGVTVRRVKVQQLSVACKSESANEHLRWEPTAPEEVPPPSRAGFVRGLKALRCGSPAVRDAVALFYADQAGIEAVCERLNMGVSMAWKLIGRFQAEVREVGRLEAAYRLKTA